MRISDWSSDVCSSDLDGAGADVDARADLRVAQVGQVVGLAAHAHARVLGLDEVAHVHAVGEHGARAQPRERANLHRAFGARAVDVAVRADLGAGGEVGVADAAERSDAPALAARDAPFEHDLHVDLDYPKRTRLNSSP